MSEQLPKAVTGVAALPALPHREGANPAAGEASDR